MFYANNSYFIDIYLKYSSLSISTKSKISLFVSVYLKKLSDPKLSIKASISQVQITLLSTVLQSLHQVRSSPFFFFFSKKFICQSLPKFTFVLSVTYADRWSKFHPSRRYHQTLFYISEVSLKSSEKSRRHFATLFFKFK